jgi:flagellar biosynthesis GTPase FlhF
VFGLFILVYSSALLITMTDKQESAISDPRASLQNFSNRQDSSFQYGDPPKYQTDVNTSKTKTENIEKTEQINIFEEEPYDTEEVRNREIFLYYICLFQADKKFLESKPTCFLLLGKPGVGKTTLARKLADDWHAELINSKSYLYYHLSSIFFFFSC